MSRSASGGSSWPDRERGYLFDFASDGHDGKPESQPEQRPFIVLHTCVGGVVDFLGLQVQPEQRERAHQLTSRTGEHDPADHLRNGQQHIDRHGDPQPPAASGLVFQMDGESYRFRESMATGAKRAKKKA